jgi:molybdopterin/thiamine biosynthesis adenylyltransferase
MSHGTQINSSEAALYDRQIRLWGVKAQNQLKKSRTLCIGLNALGAELCKNIVLAGLNVTVLDDTPVTPRDVGECVAPWGHSAGGKRLSFRRCC